MTTMHTPSPKGTMPDNIEQWTDGPPFGRVKIELSAEDERAVNALGEHDWTTITDTLTGHSFVYRRADCGAGCYCAAEIEWDIDPRFLAGMIRNPRTGEWEKS